MPTIISRYINNKELEVPSIKETLSLVAKKAFEGLTKKATLPTLPTRELMYGELPEDMKKRLEEIMLSAQSMGIHKAQAIPKLLAGLFKKKTFPISVEEEIKTSQWKLLVPEERKNVARAMSKIMLAPQKELKELKQIVWRGTTQENIKGEYLMRSLIGRGYGPPETLPRIELNPYRVGRTTFMHEILHKKHEFPQPGEEKLALGLREATSEAWKALVDQYRIRGGGVPKDVAEKFYFTINQTEAMARDLSKVVLWNELERVYKMQLPGYSARAEQWLDKIAGEGATKKMWEGLLEGYK